MASLNDVLQGLVNVDNKVATHVHNILATLGNGFIEIGDLSLANNTLTLKNATVLIKGKSNKISSLSCTFSGNKICFLKYTNGKFSLVTFNTVDSNFTYDLSKLEASSLYFAISRQYNNVYEDVRTKEIVAVDDSIIATINNILTQIDELEGSVTTQLDNLNRTITNNINGQIANLQNTKADASSLKNYQTKTDNSLITSDKTITGAINELFQDVDSGKQLIADAIDKNGITKNSTFSAMGTAINSINSEVSSLTNTMSSDKQKLLNILIDNGYSVVGDESMSTLIDLLEVSDIDLTSIIDIQSSGDHAILLKDDGTVWGVGKAWNGALGLGEGASNQSVFIPLPIDNAKIIGAGTGSTFVYKNDGTLWACGWNCRGQLGLNISLDLEQDYVYEFTQVPNMSNVKKILGGYNTTVIIKDDGSIWASGIFVGPSNALFGTGTSTSTRIAFERLPITSSKNFTYTSSHSINIREDGTVWVSGYNNSGQLGLGTEGSSAGTNTYTQVTLGIGSSKARQALAVTYTSYLLLEDGSFWSTGSYLSGPNETSTRTQFACLSTGPFTKMFNSGSTIFLLKNDNTLWCYGSNTLNIAGYSGDYAYIVDKSSHSFSGNIISIVGSSNTAYFLCDNQSLYCIGSNYYGQLGLSDNNPRTTLTELQSETELLIKQIQAYQQSETLNKGSLASIISSEGIVVSEEDDVASLIPKVQEALELRDTHHSYLESYITSIINQRLAKAGTSYTHSLDTIDLVNAITNLNISPNHIKDIASSDTMVMVVLEDANNSLYVWGHNPAGQLGLPTTSQSYPTPTLTATNVLSVAAGFNHSFYIDTIGRLYGVGHDDYGKLGGIGSRTSWKYITDNVKKVVCVENTSFILKKDGTLLGCGKNNVAMFGHPASDTFERNELVNIASNVVDMTITTNSSYIIKDDGSLWVSGKNSIGQLGVGDKVDRETFTKVYMPNGLKVLKVTASVNHAVVIAEDGYLYCCGDNSDGQLGLSVSECSTFTRYTGHDDIAYPVKDVVANYNDSFNIDSPSQTYVLDARGHVFVAGYHKSNMGRSILDFSKASHASNTTLTTFTFDNVSIPSGYDKYSFINDSPRRIILSAYKANSNSQIFLEKEIPAYSPALDGPSITDLDFEGNSKLKIVLRFYKSDYWGDVNDIKKWAPDFCLCHTDSSSFNYIGLDWDKYVCKVSLAGSSTHLYTSDGKVYSAGEDGYYDLMTTDVGWFTERNDIP